MKPGCLSPRGTGPAVCSPVTWNSETHSTLALKTKNGDLNNSLDAVISLLSHLCYRSKDFSLAPF